MPSGNDCLLVLALVAACGPARLVPSPELRALSPESLPPAQADVSNRFAEDPAAALFGQRLFFDAGFSGKLIGGDNDGGPHALGRKGESGKVSCAGCHMPGSAFTDTRSLGMQVSLAAFWSKRKTPSLFDVGQSRLFHADGRHDALWNQPFGPLENVNEMNSGRLFVAQEIFRRHRAEYEALFGALPPLDNGARFPPLTGQTTGCELLPGAVTVCRGQPGDGAEYDGLSPDDKAAVTRVVVNLGKALGAYQRRLTCGPSRFDRWVHGDAGALTLQEQRGAFVFAGRGRCLSCHGGPFLSDEKFHNVGLAAATVAVVINDRDDRGAAVGLAQAILDPLNTRGTFSDGDDGRLPATAPAGLEGSFRTPRLRCVSRRPSFLHTGQFSTLEAVIEFFDRGGHRAGYPGTNELQPLGLSTDERAELAVFLRALDGPGPETSLLHPP